jgi:hypothetical protein
VKRMRSDHPVVTGYADNWSFLPGHVPSLAPPLRLQQGAAGLIVFSAKTVDITQNEQFW